MDNLNSIFNRLPEPLKGAVRGLPEQIRENMEELRIQIKQPVRVISGGKEAVIEISEIINRELMNQLLNNLLNYSIYAYEDDLARGYVTIEGGHRVGVCGRVVTENGNIKLIKEISSLNIRRSREIKGVSEKILPEIYNRHYGLQNTIIVSPPKCGKTTLIRDIIRVVSEMGERVSVCDERSEIAGMYGGSPSYDLGPRTDVLDGCIKAEGMMMLIRSMSPDIIVTDEIGRPEDTEAIEAAVSSGVRILTTIHGSNYEDLIASPIGHLIERGIFKRIVFMSNEPATGTITQVKYV